jgi:hypothetical protein
MNVPSGCPRRVFSAISRDRLSFPISMRTKWVEKYIKKLKIINNKKEKKGGEDFR